MESRYSIINLNALEYNFSVIKKLIGLRLVMPIIKANAYGHGLGMTAQFFQHCKADFLGVALIEEAVQLRNQGITLPILVLGSIIPEHIPLFLLHDIDIMASSVEKLTLINTCAQTYQKKARVHLKIDTGLGRVGVRSANAETFFMAAVRLPYLSIIGVASHFATADQEDQTYMQEQYEKFCQALSFFERYSLPMPIRHIANSGAILQYPQSHLDMVRPGIMLYGVYPHTWMQSLYHLKPVLSLHARIVYFKVLLAGTGISYGLTWNTEKNTRIITVPLGYGDGYPRALSNKGEVLLNGNRYPIVGNICMDQLMVHVGDSSAYNGQEVTFIGTSEKETITINDIVDHYGGSPYEFLVTMNNRIQRRYVYNESEVTYVDVVHT